MEKKTKPTFNERFFDLQYDLPVIPKTTSAYKYKYASLPDILEEINPILKKHGFFFEHATNLDEQGSWAMVTRLRNIYAEGLLEIVLPLYSAKDMQAIGSALTYCRRYCISNLIGIVTDEDDDGQRAKGPQKQENPNTISDAQRKRLFAITRNKVWPKEKVEALLKEYGYSSSKDVQKKDYETICERIEALDLSSIKQD